MGRKTVRSIGSFPNSVHLVFDACQQKQINYWSGLQVSSDCVKGIIDNRLHHLDEKNLAVFHSTIKTLVRSVCADVPQLASSRVHRNVILKRIEERYSLKVRAKYGDSPRYLGIPL